MTGYILALDPGERVGWATSGGACGTLDLSAVFKEDVGRACDQFAAWLRPRLMHCRLLVIERAFGRAAFTSTTPDGLTFVAHMEAWRHAVRRREATASQVKKAVTGSGRAKKAEVIAAVRALGYAPPTDHAADACALLEWAMRVAADEAGAARVAIPLVERAA